MVYVQLALLIISIYLSLTMQPKTVKPKPAAFEDFEFPQVDEGTPQCVFFGDCWSGDWMVLGVGNYRTTKIVTKSGK
jgi:hypothetical protein